MHHFRDAFPRPPRLGHILRSTLSEHLFSPSGPITALLEFVSLIPVSPVDCKLHEDRYLTRSCSLLLPLCPAGCLRHHRYSTNTFSTSVSGPDWVDPSRLQRPAHQRPGEAGRGVLRAAGDLAGTLLWLAWARPGEGEVWRGRVRRKAAVWPMGSGRAGLGAGSPGGLRARRAHR